MQIFSEIGSWPTYRTILAEEFGIVLHTTPAEHCMTVRGHEVRIDEWAASGPCCGTVILVHGGGGNGRILAPFAEPVAALGWRVLAPDLPGFGLTRPSPAFDWDYAEWPRVIAALADAQTGPVVLLGASIGGLTAVFAAQQSNNVAGVVATTLLDASVDQNFIKVARWPWLGRISLLSMALVPALVDRIRLPLRLAAPLGTMSANKRMARYFTDDPLIGASWKPVRFFRTMREFTPPSLKLDCPLLLVHPGADAWTPTPISVATFDRFEARKQFVELSNGSHLPVEQPAYRELSEQVARFLQESRC
jgi:alpha-beta hydrolase superfamily lysophospholipase